MRESLSVHKLKVKRSKTFQLVIDRLNLPAGKILGIAGPNGSGKTTLLETLSGILMPDAGEILVGGVAMSRNLRETKAVLGYIPDDDNWFVPELTAREYIKLVSKVYADAGKPVAKGRVRALAKQLGFTQFDQRLDTLSHGNKKKVQLIAGLMHKPDVIIIDELRNGLDPLAIISAEELIKSEAARGAAIIAASHDLWWAERVTDEILLLSEGKKLAHAPTKNLIGKYGSLEKLFIGIANGKIRIPKT